MCRGFYETALAPLNATEDGPNPQWDVIDASEGALVAAYGYSLLNGTTNTSFRGESTVYVFRLYAYKTLSSVYVLHSIKFAPTRLYIAVMVRSLRVSLSISHDGLFRYVSGTSGTIFSASLANVLFTTLGEDTVVADVVPLPYIRGVYFATQHTGSPSHNTSAAFDGVQYTMVTFDFGAAWQRLPVPLGAPSTCAADVRETCSLHLHLNTIPLASAVGGLADIPGILGCASAPGLAMVRSGLCSLRVHQCSVLGSPGVHRRMVMMRWCRARGVQATGNVGTQQQLAPTVLNVYFTQDAGATWAQISTGPAYYAFANGGGLLVLANPQHAGALQWSTDYGPWRQWPDPAYRVLISACA